MDEQAARAEIKALSENARAYLAHNIRNPLQMIYGGAEIGDMEIVKEGARDLKNRIEGAGL